MRNLLAEGETVSTPFSSGPPMLHEELNRKHKFAVKKSVKIVKYVCQTAKQGGSEPIMHIRVYRPQFTENDHRRRERLGSA